MKSAKTPKASQPTPRAQEPGKDPPRSLTTAEHTESVLQRDMNKTTAQTIKPSPPEMRSHYHIPGLSRRSVPTPPVCRSHHIAHSNPFIKLPTHSSTPSNTHSPTPCNTLQRPPCNTVQHPATPSKTHSSTPSNTHSPTPCNTVQHLATPSKTHSSTPSNTHTATPLQRPPSPTLQHPTSQKTSDNKSMNSINNNHTNVNKNQGFLRIDKWPDIPRSTCMESSMLAPKPGLTHSEAHLEGNETHVDLYLDY
ncbi:putative uncharacterized protein DDB_G0290521 [Penaeus indicus]|uniref:putative uncharacterized protein DDB_G0290521 n=1 Tax=Penaeus indicus TaxID=29960 RepID=UPI00300CF6F4